MIHTLNKLEYKELINGSLHKEEYSENFEYVKDLYDSSKYWDIKIYGLNHLLSVVLEQFIKSDKDANEIIEFIYSFPDSCNFEIQESCEYFIENLYENLMKQGMSLEEHLIMVQNKIG